MGDGQKSRGRFLGGRVGDIVPNTIIDYSPIICTIFHNSMKPQLLFLSSFIDVKPIIVKEIFEIIKKIHESGITIFLVEQNVGMAMSIAEYVYIIQNGMIVIGDKTTNLKKRDDIRRTYLGW